MGLNTISVGIDRSDTAHDALAWAVSLAKESAATVRVVSTWQMPLVASLPGGADRLPTANVLIEQCETTLAGAVADLESGVAVEQRIVEGAPGPALVGESETSDLLVVGRTGQGKRRGLTRFAEIALGSTARHCVHNATSAVVTVPQGSKWRQQANVVVGLDGSDSSLGALAWALTSLAASTRVHVVRAFAPWVGDGLFPVDVSEDDAVYDAVRAEVQGWIDQVSAQTANGLTEPLKIEVGIGSARDVLTDREYDVDMIVVGERGHTGVAAKVLGSISDHLVRYAACPVVVVPDDEHRKYER